VQSTAKEAQQQENEKEAKNRYEHENFVSINGEKYEKEKEYRFYYTDNGQTSQVVGTAGYFNEKILKREGVKYSGKHDAL
jgi:hypothetical protein